MSPPATEFCQLKKGNLWLTLSLILHPAAAGLRGREAESCYFHSGAGGRSRGFLERSRRQHFA